MGIGDGGGGIGCRFSVSVPCAVNWLERKMLNCVVALAPEFMIKGKFVVSVATPWTRIGSPASNAGPNPRASKFRLASGPLPPTLTAPD